MKVLLTGATGMVGKGVLLECLDDPSVVEILSISRKPVGIQHPKLKELIHADFTDFSQVENRLAGFDACFACMGVSAAGMDEQTYTERTFTMTMELAKACLRQNTSMTFIYVSGQGTDSSEKGRSMWARVKGKTENALLSLGFQQAYMFRPGAIIPLRGIQPSSRLYRIMINNLTWLIRCIKWIAPQSVVDTTQLGKAMIHVVQKGYEKSHLTPKDIQILAA
jgi:uncharacterized protein YbjT (DUF2867 family)